MDSQKIIEHIFKRPGMYVQPLNFDTLHSLLVGLSLSSNPDSQFLSHLSAHIENKYHIEPNQCGLRGQLLTLAERRESDLLPMFIYTSKEVLGLAVPENSKDLMSRPGQPTRLYWDDADA